MLVAEKPVSVFRELLERLSDARRRSDTLFAMVRSDFLYERPILERHRIIFYVGHLESFDWNLLNKDCFGLQSIHPEFDRLFAFGIDPVGGGLPTDQPADWPSLDAVREYVSRIRNVLDESLANVISESDFRTRDGFPLRTLLNVAVEHRLMHVETLSYMLHQLPFHMKVRASDSRQPVGSPVTPDLVSISAGVVTLGLSREGGAFGWDNEFEAHNVEVPAFEIDKYKVTNREYLEFVEADGYRTRDVWSDDDWNWKESHGISHPLFWRSDGEQWFWRTMFDEVPLPLDWPVYVSHAEASAYARWAGKSLPTEAEWQQAAYGTIDGTTRTYPFPYPYAWGNRFEGAGANGSEKLGNFDFRCWDPVSVNAFPEGQSAFGVQDMMGNGWEWTSSIFAPFPGFEAFPFYRGYSADFFDGKHFVMKGGSARTALCMLRPTFRNWFQAHYQYVYAGFRCVRR